MNEAARDVLETVPSALPSCFLHAPLVRSKRRDPVMDTAEDGTNMRDKAYGSYTCVWRGHAERWTQILKFEGLRTGSNWGSALHSARTRRRRAPADAPGSCFEHPACPFRRRAALVARRGDLGSGRAVSFASAFRLELVLAFGFGQGGVLSGLHARLWTSTHELRRHHALTVIPCSGTRSCLLLLIFCSRTPAGARSEGFVRTFACISVLRAPFFCALLACVCLRPWIWCYLPCMRAPRCTPHRWTSSLN